MKSGTQSRSSYMVHLKVSICQCTLMKIIIVSTTSAWDVASVTETRLVIIVLCALRRSTQVNGCSISLLLQVLFLCRPIVPKLNHRIYELFQFYLPLWSWRDGNFHSKWMSQHRGWQSQLTHMRMHTHTHTHAHIACCLMTMAGSGPTHLPLLRNFTWHVYIIRTCTCPVACCVW